MTEDEAKTKWCPFTRAGFADAGGTNNRLDGSLHCIASACMAWRPVLVQDDRERALFRKDTGERVKAGHSDLCEWRLVNPDDPPPPAQGFCGLAGRPE